MPTEHLVILMDLSNVLDVVGQGNDAHFSHLMGSPENRYLTDWVIWPSMRKMSGSTKGGYMRRIVMGIAMSSASDVNFDMTIFDFND